MRAYGEVVPEDPEDYNAARIDRDLMRAYGEVVPEDPEDYNEWFRKAADVQFNFVAAVRWFRTVAEHEQGYVNSAEAQFNLGVIYDIGLGVPEDKAEATRWFRKAADDRHFTAQLITGQIGYQDDAEELKWLRRGAALGFARAQCKLGSMYESGEVVPKNYMEAAKWYRKAAGQGKVWWEVRYSQYRLGFMYMLGQGVPKDYVRAYAWWNFAATQGETDTSSPPFAESAAEARDELEASMTAEQIARAQELSATIFSRINPSE